MPDWEVKVITESNYIKSVRVDDCAFRNDAETQALSSTGAVRVISSNPKQYDDEIRTQTVEVNQYNQPVYVDYEEDEDDSSSLDEMEEEMYDLMCQIAMSKGEELPTIQEFYEYLDNL